MHSICCNLPFNGRATRGSWVCLPRKENAQSCHQRLFKENVGKTGKSRALRTLSVNGSGVVFTHGEGISTPRVRHKGWQPLIKCAKYDFNLFYLPFFTLFIPFIFFYLSVVDKGVSLAPTYSSIVIRKSDLRSSLRTERWLSCFYLYCKIYFD